MARCEFKLPGHRRRRHRGRDRRRGSSKPGDAVKEDQPMVEVMTDKATVTITAPKAGQGRRDARQGRARSSPCTRCSSSSSSTAARRPALAAAGAGAARATRATATAAKDDGPAATAVGDIKETLPGMGALPRAPPPRRAHGRERRAYFNDKPLATPATRKLARELDVDLRQRAADAARTAASRRTTSRRSHGARGARPGARHARRAHAPRRTRPPHARARRDDRARRPRRRARSRSASRSRGMRRKIVAEDGAVEAHGGALHVRRGVRRRRRSRRSARASRPAAETAGRQAHASCRSS